jgi:hypothetical protein
MFSRVIEVLVHLGCIAIDYSNYNVIFNSNNTGAEEMPQEAKLWRHIKWVMRICLAFNRFLCKGD